MGHPEPQGNGSCDSRSTNRRLDKSEQHENVRREEPPGQAQASSDTYFRVTLIFVGLHQNITLSVPRELLKRVKRLAADRDTSVSALMTEALDRLADEERRYSAARKRALAALRSPRSLGTGGRRTWSRDELHER
jgi:predicted transcriptional regulator